LILMGLSRTDAHVVSGVTAGYMATPGPPGLAEANRMGNNELLCPWRCAKGR
jgi:hypothetical protein